MTKQKVRKISIPIATNNSRNGKTVFYGVDADTTETACDYDASNILYELKDSQTKTIMLTLEGIALSIVIIFFIIRSIMKGLNGVNAKLFDLVNNEGDLTQKLEIKSGDELELIAENVNAMLEYIRGIMINIASGSFQLNSSSQLVVSNLAAAQDSITDVSATMEEMSAGMEETSAALFEINNAILDITEEITTINGRAEDGRDSSDAIMVKAAGVYQNAIIEQEAAKCMADEMSASVNEKIETSKAVETISVLTENIISITNQTNLLSLNASIEAEKMIQFMDETAMTGYEKLLSTSKDYQNDVGNMNQMMTEFAVSSESLRTNVEAIRESVSSVNIAIEENTKGINNISEATVNITTSVDDIGTEANANLDIATGLDTEVNRFKLN